jgi:hypothetical protein
MKPTAFSRVPADLLAKIEQAATENDRSLSAELRCLLREGLSARAANGSNGK